MIVVTGRISTRFVLKRVHSYAMSLYELYKSVTVVSLICSFGFRGMVMPVEILSRAHEV